MVVAGFYVIYGVHIDRKLLYRLLPTKERNRILEERYTFFCDDLDDNVRQLKEEIEEETIESDLWELVVNNGSWLPIADKIGLKTERGSTDSSVSSYKILAAMPLPPKYLLISSPSSSFTLTSFFDKFTPMLLPLKPNTILSTPL